MSFVNGKPYEASARGRPAGDVRRAIYAALQQQGPLPLREIAVHSQVGYGACRCAVSNALRANRLAIVGRAKVAHAKQWVALYDVVETPQPARADVLPAVGLLADAMRAWR